MRRALGGEGKSAVRRRRPPLPKARGLGAATRDRRDQITKQSQENGLPQYDRVIGADTRFHRAGGDRADGAGRSDDGRRACASGTAIALERE